MNTRLGPGADSTAWMLLTAIAAQATTRSELRIVLCRSEKPDGSCMLCSCMIDLSDTRRANLTEHPTVNKVGNGSKVPYLDVMLAGDASQDPH